MRIWVKIIAQNPTLLDFL